MNLVQAPITLGQIGENVTALQESILWLIQNNILRPLDIDQLDTFYEEKSKSFFGSATNYMVGALSQLLGFETANGIDDNAAGIINNFIASHFSPTSPVTRKITGLVKNNNGKPMGNVQVEVYAIALRERNLLGTTTTTEDGRFELDYQLPEDQMSPPGTGYTGVQVIATANDYSIDGTSAPSYEVASPVYFDTSNTIYTELIIPVDSSDHIIAEYTALRQKITNITGSSFESLTEDDTSFLTGCTSENETTVHIFLLAQVYSRQSAIAPETFYGIMRRSMPQTLEVIYNMSQEQLTEALQFTVATNLIPHMDASAISTTVQQLKIAASSLILGDAGKEAADAKAYKILSYVLSADQMSSFLQYYYQNDTSDPDFWNTDNLTQSVLDLTNETATQLKQAISYALISGSNPGMVQALLTQPAGYYAGQSVEGWVNLINNTPESDFVYPEGFAASDDRVNNYAAYLKRNYDAAFPALTFHNNITSDSNTSFVELQRSINGFSTNNPSFDLLRTPVSELKADDSSFDFSAVENKTAFIDEVSALQRLNAVVPSYQAVADMHADGLTSAMDIVQTNQEDFVERYAISMGGDANARNVYNQAVTNHLLAQAYSLNIFQKLQLPTPVISKLQDNAHTDWHSLFGNVDFCTCSDCMSVFSPAAYFVDSLELLRRNNLNAYNWLKKKRSDLWDLKLTCKNTNTAFPYIDLVNEILEGLMSVADSNAFISPSPISANDTTLDSKTLRAVPEYINSAGTASNLPYNILKNAVYPWTVPYNYFKEQTEEYLNLIDLKPYQVAKTFSKVSNADTLNDIDLACTYLGITDTERDIIEDISYGNIHSYYGLLPLPKTIISPSDRTIAYTIDASTDLLPAPTATSAGFLNAVDIFMQQTGLSFTDVLELLDCYYINPINNSTRPLSITTISDTECDTSQMTIQGLTWDYLLPIQRFIRLQRHTGWSKYELDRVLTAIGVAAKSPFSNNNDHKVIITVAQIKRMTEMLNCQVDDILPLWGDINYMPYSKYSSEKPVLIPTQYESFFRNSTLVPDFKNLAGYPFGQNFTTWRDSLNNPPLTAMDQSKRNYIFAAFNISEQDFDYLVAYFSGDSSLGSFDMANSGLAFTYSNILKLYRESTFSRLLHLSVKEWCFFRKWMKGLSIDPFVYNGTAGFLSATINFITKVKVIRNSALSANKLAYLFSSTFTDDVDKTQQQNILFTHYKGLRTALNKLNVSVLDGNGNVDALSLQQKIALVLDPTDADFMVNIVGNLSLFDSQNTYYEFSDVDLNHFVSLLPKGLTNTDIDTLTAKLIGTPETPSTSVINYTETNSNARLALINDIYTHSILKVEVRNYLSTVYKLELGISEALLNKWIAIDGAKGYNILIDENYINSSEEPDTNTLGYPKMVLTVLECFSKAAQIISAGKLTAADLDFFLENRPQLGIPDFANLPTGNALTSVNSSEWIKLLEWLDIRLAMMPSPTGLTTVLDATIKETGSKKQAWFNAIEKALQISEDDLKVLIGEANNIADTGMLGINFNSPASPYLDTESYRKLLAALDMRAVLEVNMASCKNIASTALFPQTQADADYVVQAIKARFSNEEWLDKVQPINDRLRIGRRDAMVAYLLAHPPIEYRQQWVSANDIYESLLIDTEVMPLVQTSRIKQAISSVQLFIDRCQLQEETAYGNNSPIQLTAETVSQWSMWRKWYRIWEANRKVFVYPENWIEPDLRDDKSPFFKELEKYLKQNDITADTMEDAYRTYLERLDQVAHLDVIGYYTEDIKNGSNVIDTIVHVWGRTKSNPHIYYYRKRVAGTWGAWEKMETQIDGDNFAPVKWRGRLRLYWLSFTEQVKEEKNVISVNEEQPYPKKYWKIELNWTELKNGRWQPKQIGKEWLETEPDGPWRAIDIQWNYAHTSSSTPNVKPYTIDTFKDSFQFLKTSMMPYARINAEGDLEIIVHGRKKWISQTDLNTYIDNKSPIILPSDPIVRVINVINSLQAGNVQYLGVRKSKVIRDVIKQPLKSVFIDLSYLRDEYTKKLMDSFLLEEYEYFANEYYNSDKTKFEEFKGRFTIKHNRVHADQNNLPIEFYDRLVENLPYIPTESHYCYNQKPSVGYEHITSFYPPNKVSTVQLIKQTPGFSNAPSPNKYLVFPRMVPIGYNGTYIPFPKFFYKDYKNSFYVERVTLPRTTPKVNEADIQPKSNDYSLIGMEMIAGSGSFSSNQSTGSGKDTSGMFNGTYYYRFYPFYHYRVYEIIDQLDRYGLDGIFDWAFISDKIQKDEIKFAETYIPTQYTLHYLPNNVSGPNANDVYPKSSLNFSYDDPNAIYNWELFFHIPLLIANKLMQDQKFDDAMKWFHYVFNPTNVSGTSHGSGSERFWQFHPFYKESQQPIPSIDDIMNSPDLQNAVNQWAHDPFKPHLVARTRISAYMKNVLMKYLDNLIAWGDQLFRRDTMESINEATLLYILAAQLLGKAPVKMPARVASASKTYNDFASNPSSINAFSNASVAVETVLAPTGVSPNPSATGIAPLHMMYFCLPPNDKLLSYWDVVADRLFKIRNSQSIDGVERQLALFEPPIDPALLVRAAASGVSLSDAVNELFAPLPQYRFSVMVQKAAELTQEVKGLGSNLLAAIEKKDAERIALLRSGHELSVLEAAKEVRQMQIQEAQAQLAGLQEQQKMVTTRRDYYQGLIDKGLNAQEQSQLDSLMLSIPLKTIEGSHYALANGLGLIPDVKLGSAEAATYFGGSFLSEATRAVAASIGVASTVNDIFGSMAGIKAGHERRKEDWNQQLKLANAELKQLDKQLVAAEIRQAIAEKELSNHELQYKNAQELDQAMHDKYSNEDLYDWMISQISLTYFQSYKLAFDVAKRAERCYSFELGVKPTTPFINFGYWDSLKKGLLAGEALLYDIKRMDVSYLDQNKRQHELTKHISLAALNPQALIELKEKGKITNGIDFHEWLFDMDYPGHYMRRIKSISISIPCVAGPYTTVSAKLTLNSSQYRTNSTIISGLDYDDSYYYTPVYGGGQSIATSTAQNDNGMFEMNFRDERYLPFEGAGVISNWSLELPSKYASFDWNSISDVIFHVHYTAKYDGGSLATKANDHLAQMVKGLTDAGAVLPRLFNLKQEFANEWNAYISQLEAGNTAATLSLPIHPDMFPFFCKGRQISLSSGNNIIIKMTQSSNATGYSLTVTNDDNNATICTLSPSSNYKSSGTIGTATIDEQYTLRLKFSAASPTMPSQLPAALKNVDSLWFALMYTVS